MSRIHNFSAGPAVLPLPVLESTREALLELNGSGLGLAECSHRSALFNDVLTDTQAKLRELLRLDDDQELLFLPGGASSQFFMLPMNLLRGQTAAYLDTGRWSSLAMAEARRYGTVQVAYSSKDSNYDHVPAQGQWALDSSATYLHYTSNNTVCGTAFRYVPQVEVPLVSDMSSNILSEPIDGSQFALIYAGAQKNIGPAGITLVVFRKRLLERCDPELPTMLRYATHVAKNSLHSTPNTIAIYMVGQVADWIASMGGLPALAARNRAQADRVYQVIDASDFWRGYARPGSRSIMNLTFTTGQPKRDAAFLKQAAQAGLTGLKGHRSVGGLRASLYNAQTDEAVQALVDVMREFERTQG